MKIVSTVQDNVSGHCLLLQEKDRLVLIDTGIGLLDTQYPQERIGQALIDIVGYRFHEEQTALRQIESLGLNPTAVTDCIISHLDNDHIGGLADFPKARVHVSEEEYASFKGGNPRYLQIPLAHNPTIKTYAKSDVDWFGFEARKIEANLETEIYLIPLFGHTLGHCGIALKVGEKCFFYIADAYYLRAELTDSQHPVHELARMREENNDLRIASLDKIRQLLGKHPEIEVFGYHDIEEFLSFNSFV